MIERPRGTNDWGPDEATERQHALRILRETAETWGFREIETPTFERLDLFVAKSGPAIVDQLYAFDDRGGRRMALRPEFTASVVRFYNQDLRNLPKPVKVFCEGNCFRYEEPQKGRYREFRQFNVEIFGAPGLEGDAEILAFAITALRQVGMRQVEARVGHIGMLRSFLGLQADDQAKVLHLLDKRDFEALHADLERLGKTDLEEALREAVQLKGGPEVLDEGQRSLGDGGREGFEYLRALGERLSAYGLDGSFVFDLGVVRGLDYYTGMVFEIDSPNLGAEKQVGGGGAYSLSEAVGGEPVASTGFAFGLDRIVMAAAQEGVTGPPRRLDAYVVPIGDGARAQATRIASELRRTGLTVDLDLVGRGPSKNLDYANAIRARTAVIVGEREIASGSVTVKDMDRGDQTTVPVAGLADAIRARSRTDEPQRV